MNLMEDIHQQLDLISSNCLKKRLKREFIKFADNELLQILSVRTDERKLPIVSIADINGDNVAVYEFHVSGNYPFCPPKVFINGIAYIDFLRIKTRHFTNILKKITGFSCLCCHSYLCGENWTPTITIEKFINEIRFFRKNRRNIVNKYYADLIKDKYLVDDINLDEWLY